MGVPLSLEIAISGLDPDPITLNRTCPWDFLLLLVSWLQVKVLMETRAVQASEVMSGFRV